MVLECSRRVTSLIPRLMVPSPLQPVPYRHTAVAIDLWPFRMYAFILQLLFINWLPVEKKVLQKNGLRDLVVRFTSSLLAVAFSTVPSPCDADVFSATTGATRTTTTPSSTMSSQLSSSLGSFASKSRPCTESPAMSMWPLIKTAWKAKARSLVLWACFLLLPTATDARLFTSQMSPRVVSTQYGQIRGVLITLPDTHLPMVEAYLGLQYASILGGELRFMPPTSPMETWDGIRVALKFRPVCPQKKPLEKDLLKTLPVGRVEHFKRIIPFLERQAEECLNLNIYVPVRGKTHLAISYYLAIVLNYLEG